MRPGFIFLAALLVAVAMHATLLRVPLGPRLPVQEPGQDQLRMQVVFRPTPPEKPEPEETTPEPEPEPPPEVPPEPEPVEEAVEPELVPPSAAYRAPAPEEQVEAPLVEQPDALPVPEEQEEELPVVEEPFSPVEEPAVMLPDAGDVLGEGPLHPYWEQVRRAVGSHLIYPREARRRYLEGRVRISLSIDREGNVAQAVPVEEPARRMFIEAALDAVERAAPFPRPDSDVLAGERATAILPVRFEMEDRGL
jgi:protein TonB